MANWRSYIDPSIGDGQNTIDGIIANGATYGLQISDDLSVTGLSTFSDVARFSSTVRLDGQLRDGDNNFGTSGQVLSSDGTDTRWVSSGSLAAGAASQVAINDDSNTNASRFLTFVDSSSGNNSIKTDPQLTYNPSTNVISTAGVDLSDNSRIRFGNGNDLRISHTSDLSSQNDSNGDSVLDGSTWASYIQEAGTGPLIFKSNGGPSTGAFQFYDTSWRPILKLFSGSGARAALYYAGSEKLVTSSSGLTVTGTAVATAFSGPLTGNVTGNLTGNADTATILANTRTIGGVSFNGSVNINLPGVNQAGNQNTSGNAATATKLATARNIGGVSFDGSAAINLPGVNQSGNQDTSGNAATATVLATTRAFSISGEVTANSVNFNGSGGVTLNATVDDNVIDEANLKVSNAPSNGKFLQCNTGVTGGLTWADVTIPSSNTLSGTTLASGITASSITSLGTLSSLSVSGNITASSSLSVSSNVTVGGNITISGNASITGTANIDNTITLDSKNEAPSHDKGVIIIQPSTSGGRTGINLRSKVNSDSDHGYLWWYDDNNNYANHSSNAENGVIVLGVQNDASSSSAKDAVAIESAGNIFLNPGLNDNSYGGASGPNFGRGKVYIGRESTKYQVWHEGNDGPSSGLDADKLDNQEGSYYRNASNLNDGTIPNARLSSSSLFVTGMIILWSGAQNSIPTGWVICDGNNNTPDLRNRFIVGAGFGGSYSPNNTGGSSSILLGTANLPAHTHQLGGTTGNRDLGNHNHSFSGSGSSSHSHSFPIGSDDDDSDNAIDNLTNAASQPGNFSTNNATVNISISGTTGNKNLGNHNHSLPATTGNQGGAMNTAFDNRPPYYALCYIMKT